MVIYADFGASLDLQAREKDNCATNHHAVICITCCLHGWKEVSYDRLSKDGNMLTEKCAVSECDRWIVFADSMTRGKKNDHIAHHHFLRHMMDQHELTCQTQSIELFMLTIVEGNASAGRILDACLPIQ